VDVTAEEVRDEVRSHYAQRAEAARAAVLGAGQAAGQGVELVPLTDLGLEFVGLEGGSCCGTAGDAACCGTGASSDGGAVLYDPADLALLPEEMRGMSWGCGNPTAITALGEGEVVLDLGSGAGFDVLLAARKVGPTGFVYGVDMTDEMLALARRNAEKAGASNVEFRKGHIEDIPLPEQTVDVIISNCVVNLAPDKGQVLADAFRVLRPGGRVAISDIVVDGRLDDLPVSEAQIRTALSWAGCIAGALTVEQYKALLAAAGFEEIAVTVKHRYTLEELGQDLGGVAETLPLEVAQQLVGRFTSCDIAARRPA
jgi:SAM-dependent methyltransferase